MKQHEITMDDMIKAMDQEIIIASHSKAGRGVKSIKFNPSSLKYRVGCIKGEFKTINDYLDPLIAMEIYNNTTL